jgi:homocysteine S-methyltransferase
MGTRLIEKGEKFTTPIWSAEALIKNPDLVLNIHKEYNRAGADIIRTNTFRTNPYSISYFGENYDSADLVKIAVDLAKSSIEPFERGDVILAGANAPADDCYSQSRRLSLNELFVNHSEHIISLIENGVDFILNETFGDKEEIEIVSKFCYQNKIPFAVSVLIKNESETYHGQKLKDTLQSIFQYDPLFISLNCCRPEILIKTIKLIREFKPFGVYPNLGSVNSFNTNNLIRDFTVTDLTALTNFMLEAGVSVIGVCCGGNPDDISIIRNLIDSSENEIQ